MNITQIDLYFNESQVNVMKRNLSYKMLNKQKIFLSFPVIPGSLTVEL